MDKNKDSFAKNERYISHIKYLKSLEESRKPILINIPPEEAVSTNKKNLNKSKNEPKKTSNYISPISRVNMITTFGYMKNNFLNVGFYYHNRSTDKLIFWKKGTVSADCKVYGNAGDWIKPRQGSLIGQLSNNTITSSLQKIYIELRKTHYELVIIDCSLTINGKIF